MSPYSIAETLFHEETRQHENLIALLGTFKGSKTSGTGSQLPSLVRGLCTGNQKLLQLASQCMADLNAFDEEIEPFKSFVNEFIIWFDQKFVIFEKLLECLSAENMIEGDIYQQPLLHCAQYVTLATAAMESLRNPFVIEKLADVKSRATCLLDRNHAILKRAQLNDISFDHVRTFSGRSVACFFTAEQIVERTEDCSVFMDQQKKTRIELLLLNLSHLGNLDYDAFAVLKVPETRQANSRKDEKRSVIYPPFRVNELSMSLSPHSIQFTCLSHEQNQGQASFSVSGPRHIIDKWFEKLKVIFPTDGNEKLLYSKSVVSQGLGIETVSDSSEEDSTTSPCTPGEFENYSTGLGISDVSGRHFEPSEAKEPRRSLDSVHSFQIMKKTLSGSGISADDKEKQLTVLETPAQHRSISAEVAYPEENYEDMCSITDSIECLEMSPLPSSAGIGSSKSATASLPELSASLPATNVYINTAGSAIDVNNFGKSHNPSFASLPVSAPTSAKKKSFLDLFKKKKSKNLDPPAEAVERKPMKEEVSKPKSQPKTGDNEELKYSSTFNEPRSSTSTDTSTSVTSLDSELEKSVSSLPKAKANKVHPDLRIQIPKIGADSTNSSQPSSAISTSNRTLPSPFALPSSTSMQFFKPYMNGSSTDVNASSGSVNVVPAEKPYHIPQEFKDIANSDDTIDFYITPVSPNTIKVSKWKHKYGKWELLTSNENVFLKIVANYQIDKSWLLVFKEEYDEEYDEVVDIPLLVLDLDEKTSARQSTALDVEIQSVDAFSKQKSHIIVRCYNGTLVHSITSNLSNILEVMSSKKSLRSSMNFESNATLSSSFMSKPSTSSTLTSIFTQTDQKTPASSIYRSNVTSPEPVNKSPTGNKLLLDRMTIKLHEQMESYAQIQRASSWKSLAMYSLSISHSSNASGEGFYHFDMTKKGEFCDDIPEEYSWIFGDKDVHGQMERIGKAAMLVKVSDSSIFMVECKGKKELMRLVDLF